jgi:hypothetical protein
MGPSEDSVIVIFETFTQLFFEILRIKFSKHYIIRNISKYYCVKFRKITITKSSEDPINSRNITNLIYEILHHT